ncbi:MAG: hypothetical protein U1G08_14615 [Verrucomicrobiota bacterium]
MCKLNTSEQSPIVVWEQYGDASLPRFVNPAIASEHQISEGDEIDAGMREILETVNGFLPLGNFERMIPDDPERFETIPPVAIIEL